MRFQVEPWLTNLQLPDWFEPVKTHIETAVDHARTWQDKLCPMITSAVPQSLIDYSTVFQSVSISINNLMTEIEMNGGTATKEQHDAVNGLLASLLAQLNKEVTTLSDLHTQIINLMDEIQQDYQSITGDESTISKNEPGSGVISKQIQADLGNDFLDTQVLAPCNVSVTIKMSIELKIKATAGSHQELLPYVVALELLNKAQVDNAAATQALSAVVASWQLLQDMLQDVIDKLKEASDDQVVPILRKVDFKIAEDIWSQLATFARGLMTC
jgi:hypothetical protein